MSQLRRFITLIDALYEGRVRVHVLAEKSPLELLNVSADEKSQCVHDEVFAFDRTVSRLLEMQSEEYCSNYYSEWLQRRQLPVVSALMDSVAAEATESKKQSPHLVEAEMEPELRGTEAAPSSATGNDLVPNFIVDVLPTDTLVAAWDSYCQTHTDSRDLSTAVDAPSIFVGALESHTGKD